MGALNLRRHGIGVLLVEKKSYPFHRVCGEYISNEVRPCLEKLGIYPRDLGPTAITRLQLSSVNGKLATLELGLGGFGISRYAFDHFLYEKAALAGVGFLLDTQVMDITFEKDHFTVFTDKAGSLEAEVVIGAFGKRSKLDKVLNRPFFAQRSPYMGVKYHLIHESQPHDTIALHNFHNGYCGILAIEDGKCNMCYLSARSNLELYGNIPGMEKQVLCKNPQLERIFANARFISAKPEVISEISFATKAPVEQHILMCGDAAGMIAPLCGNGMAMAIHSAMLASGETISYFTQHRSRMRLETSYSRSWNKHFRSRLVAGRLIQKLFGSVTLSNISVEIARRSKIISRFFVEQTHGQPF